MRITASDFEPSKSNSRTKVVSALKGAPGERFDIIFVGASYSKIIGLEDDLSSLYFLELWFFVFELTVSEK